MKSSTSVKFIIGIDPGPAESAWAVITPDGRLINCGIFPNHSCDFRHLNDEAIMAIEMVASYGMAVGASTFDTCFEAGRIVERFGGKFDKLFRKTVVTTICGSAKAKDSNVRQQLIDMYGGQDVAIGGKKCPACKGKGWSGPGRPECQPCKGSGWLFPPGPLHDISKDMWSALAVALTEAILSGYLSPLAVNPGGLDRSFQPSYRGILQGTAKGQTNSQGISA